MRVFYNKIHWCAYTLMSFDSLIQISVFINQKCEACSSALFQQSSIYYFYGCVIFTVTVAYPINILLSRITYWAIQNPSSNMNSVSSNSTKTPLGFFNIFFLFFTPQSCEEQKSLVLELSSCIICFSKIKPHWKGTYKQNTFGRNKCYKGFWSTFTFVHSDKNGFSDGFKCLFFPLKIQIIQRKQNTTKWTL